MNAKPSRITAARQSAGSLGALLDSEQWGRLIDAIDATAGHSIYPHKDGDVTVLGPEIFASADGRVICWRGVNYEQQRAEAMIKGPES